MRAHSSLDENCAELGRRAVLTYRESAGPDPQHIKLPLAAFKV
jgi:hypothetical protein